MHDLLPTSPGAILGYTSRGPIRLIAGGAEDDDPAPAPPDPAPAPPTPSPPPAPPTPGPAPGTAPEGVPQNPPAPDPKPEPESVDQLPKWAQKVISDLRGESAGHRTKASEAAQQAKAAQEAAEQAKTAQQAMLDQVAKALGLKDDDTPPDPAALAEQLQAAQAENERSKAERTEADAKAAATQRELEVKLAVVRSAGKHGGDADALLDSTTFLKATAGLDPAADDFADRLGEAITKAVEANPRLAKQGDPKPGRSGPEHTPPAPSRKRPAGLSEAVRNAYQR